MQELCKLPVQCQSHVMCYVCTILNVVAAAFSPQLRKKHGMVHGTFCNCHIIL